ncbi:MAG: Dolichyl-phosphate-mannose-protein mannosyltransferase-domain-containing protein [Benniella sp.]|nr:MAG: Dolichyl-phosphate-mannose-protein mannosyltransferase-domain-containing protein [Benniella sp.]
MVQRLDMTWRDWTVLSSITSVTLGVRLWRISLPDGVVLGEDVVGKAVNAYLRDEFMIDAHPPLGKLLLASVSALFKHNGSFAFDNTGDLYPGWVSFVSMRTINALMAALCSPIAYVTLKASGHGAFAAIFAATLVTFDNALTANNRLVALDAPLMFFTAAAIMSWGLFAKQRSFTGSWWGWLLLTGVAMSGAISVKLIGLVSAIMIGILSLGNLWSLTREDTVGGRLWVKYCIARFVCLIVLPLFIYLGVFQIHFSYQTQLPDYERSVRAGNDFYKLQQPFRHSFKSKSNRSTSVGTIWRDVVYGSVIQLKSEYSHGVYLCSFYITGGSRQQQVSGYEYPDLNTQWIVIRAVQEDKGEVDDEIPARLQYLKNGDFLRLRHVPTRRCLHSHNVRTFRDLKNENFNEVSAYGRLDMNGDSNDWWEVEAIETRNLFGDPTIVDKEELPIRALETTFRLKHVSLGCCLFFDDTNLPGPWGKGRKEVICRHTASVTPKSIWRIVSNEHDHLPFNTPLASYPKPTFLQKVFEMHWLMWSHKGQFRDVYHPSASKPWRWPLALSMIPAWAGHGSQVVIAPNPVVWWIGALGLVAFLGAKILFRLREKRGYFESGRIREFKHFHLGEAGTYFIGWALHYLPFFWVDRTLFIHHYFPALYCSTLVASATFSGLVGFLPRKMRLSIALSLVVLVIAVFSQLTPLTYGGHLANEQCESLSRWMNKIQGYHGHHLDCSLTPREVDRPVPHMLQKTLTRKNKALRTLRQHQTSRCYTINPFGAASTIAQRFTPRSNVCG